MEITGWVAIAILVFMNGTAQIVYHPQVLKTEADCNKIQTEALKNAPEIEGLIAVGVKCTPVVVKEIKNPKMPAKPAPPEIKT